MNTRLPHYFYIRACAIGAAAGLILGCTGAINAHHKFPELHLEVLLPQYTTVGVLVGGTAGILYYRLRFLRSRNLIGHYMSWALSLGLAVAIVVLPETLASSQWGQYAAIIGVGLVSGLGFGWYARQ